jgi:hypothetical protein
MSLNLKELEAEANRDGTMMSDDFLALLRALREARTALQEIFNEASSFEDWAHARRIKLRARTVLEGVQDD